MALDAIQPNLGAMLTGNAAARPDSVSGFHGEFSAAFQSMLRHAPESVRNELKITSGYRSPELQAQLWKDALKKYGSVAEARKWVAPPGKSKHNEGMAADLEYASDATKQWVRQNAGKHGLAFPLSNEPWHIELATARKREAVQMAQAQPQTMTDAGGAGNDTMAGDAGNDNPNAMPGYMGPGHLQAIYDAYQSGEMDQKTEGDYLRDVMSGAIAAPGPLRMPSGVWEAYRSGKMTEEERAGLEADVKAGIWQSPTAEMGLGATVADLFTGSRREVASTDALPDWGGMPEMNDLSWASFKSALGTMFTSPEETVKVLQAQYPGVEVRQDAAGTYILKSSLDGKEYAIKPGLQVSDIPRIAGGIAAFTPAGRATTLAGGAMRAAGTEALVQGSQEATGGDFNPEDVALAGATEVGGRLVAQGVRAGAGAVGRALGRGASEAAGGVPAGALPAVTETPEQAGARIGALVRQASTGGKGSRQAVIDLVKEAKVNPEAAAAAKRLGIDVPPDALIDDTFIRKNIGVVRSKLGGEAAADFEDAITRAIKQADDAFSQIGASPDIDATSTRIRETLSRTQKAAKNKAGVLFEKIRAQIDPASQVELPNLSAMLDEKARALGGVADMPADLRAYYDRVTAGPVTYGWLDQLRKDIGRGYSRTGPFKDTAAANLDELYGALAKDQAEAVRTLGGEELLALFKDANATTQAYKAAQEQIVNAFGKDLEGSLATRLRTAVTNASRGDAAAFNRVLNVIPEELQKEALATAIAAASGRSRAGQAGFSFNNFAQLYTGLERNKGLFASVMKTLGPEAKQFMSDLADISLRITNIQGKVKETGAANQAFIQALTAEGVVAKVLGGSIVRRTAQSVGAGIGAASEMAVGGPTFGAAGAATGAAMAQAMTDLAQKAASSESLKAAGKLFGSRYFKEVVEAAADNSRVPDAPIRRMARSAAFRAWARAINNNEALTKPERFILSLIQAARMEAQQSAGDEQK